MTKLLMFKSMIIIEKQKKNSFDKITFLIFQMTTNCRIPVVIDFLTLYFILFWLYTLFIVKWNHTTF